MLVEIAPGTNINHAAELLVIAAREHGEATCLFNDIPLWAGENSTTTEVIQKWFDRHAARSNPPKCRAASRSMRDFVSSLLHPTKS